METKYISPANDASVEDIMTFVRRSRSRSKPREVQNWSQPSESATKPLSLPAYACTSSLSHTAEVELCAESDSANASDPIMCGCNSSRRLEGAIEASFSDSRGKGDVPMATFPVVDVPGGHSFYRPTLPDDTGRDKGEEVAGGTRDTGALVPSPDCRSGKKAKRRRELQQENFISQNFDISDRQRRTGTLEATTERRLDCESVVLDRIKSVSGECSSGMDDVFVLRSSLESHDRPGRYSDEGGSGHDTTPIDASMSRLWETMRFQRTLDKKKMFFGCSQFPQCTRALRVPPITTSFVSLSVPSCSAPQLPEIQAAQMDVESVSSEDSFSMWEVPAETQQDNDCLWEPLPSLSPSGIRGQKALRAILELYPDPQKKDMVAQQIKKLQGTLTQK